MKRTTYPSEYQCTTFSCAKFFFVKFSSNHWFMMAFIKMKTASYDAMLRGLCRALILFRFAEQRSSIQLANNFVTDPSGKDEDLYSPGIWQEGSHTFFNFKQCLNQQCLNHVLQTVP